MEESSLISSEDFQEVYRFGSPEDLAQKLGESGIAKLLEIVCKAYSVLRDNHLVEIRMSEDEITEELVIQIECIWRKSDVPVGVVPMNQKIDRTLSKNRGRPPTIDFCFRHIWIKETFFGFECKILAEGNARLSQEYVDDGLRRYVEGKYCSTGSAGAMVGYIKSGNLAAVIEDVKMRVDKEKLVTCMLQSFSIGMFKEHYASTHAREKGLSQFCVHHLFFDLTRLD
jgi:hypothetical protein